MTNKLIKIEAPLCQLGEGLCWHQHSQTLFWLDIEGYAIHQYDPKTAEVQSYKNPKFTGMITPLDNGCLRAFADNEIWNLDPDQLDCGDKAWTQISNHFTHHAQDVLVNDGKADRFGGLIVGTKHTTCSHPTASLYYCDSTCKQGREIANTITVCNGPAFSPDGKTMYFADSPTGKIMAYDYTAGGHISNPRVFATASENAVPDGMTVDRDGYLWNAEWNGSCVKRYAPDGTLDHSIEMPVPQVTNVCFGGDRLQTLFITTAHSGLSPASRTQYPHSGATYKMEISMTQGILEPALQS